MNFSRKKFFSRAINRLYTILFRKIKEKTFGHGDNRIKYLFFPEKDNSNTALAVCFPAFAGKGAKYNYIRTLNKFNINKLFLLDDIGGTVDKGNYLIKEGIENNVKDLIQSFIDKTQAKTIIFYGSSKGGYSALNFSLDFKNVYVCIAAPQYFLADYLIKEKKYDNLKTILSNKVNDNTIQFLNNRLRDKLITSSSKPSAIYIHYSDSEHTYKEHIVDLINDIKKNGINLEEDIEHYTNHMDLVYYYPDFLKKTIKEILGIKY